MAGQVVEARPLGGDAGLLEQPREHRRVQVPLGGEVTEPAVKMR